MSLKCQSIKSYWTKCYATAAWTSPTGILLCDDCAEQAMQAVRDGASVIALLADAQGTPRERLLQHFRRLT